MALDVTYESILQSYIDAVDDWETGPTIARARALRAAIRKLKAFPEASQHGSASHNHGYQKYDETLAEVTAYLSAAGAMSEDRPLVFGLEEGRT